MKNKRLSLSKESIRTLKSVELVKVAGGDATDTCFGTVRECDPLPPTG